MKKTVLITSAVVLGCIMTLSGCREKENPATPVTGIRLNEETLALTAGKTARLSFAFLPEEAGADPSDATAEWKSSDETIATVDAAGLVTAVAMGECKIQVTVTLDDGSFDAECPVKVSAAPVETVSVNPAELTMTVGDEDVSLTAVVTPADTEYELVWTSSDEGVATVDEEGTVHAVAEGSADITATAGGKSGVCRLTVNPAPAAAVSFGDYYYSDGTWSSELDPDKTPVGVVFFAGDPTADDSYLKEKHPGCTHGIAVSIKEAGKSAWQSSMTSYGATVDSWVTENLLGAEPGMMSILFSDPFGEDVKNIQGFNNTEALRLFNEANPDYACEIIDAVDAFSAANEAPEKSSGWYLPSIMELTLMSCGDMFGVGGAIGTSVKEELNARLATISGAEALTTAEYNSSTEYNAYIAYTFDFNYGVCYTSSQKYEEYSNRCVIAF